MRITHVIDDLAIMISDNKELKQTDKDFYLGIIRAIKILLINTEK